MQTDIKEIGPCKLQVKIEIPADKIKEKLDEKYKDFMAQLTVPGFRKGLAPKDLVERKFGKDIRDEFKTDMVQTSLVDLIKEKSLKPIGDPQIDFEKITLEDTKPLAFEVVLEVEPTIELTEYTGLKVSKPPIEITDKEVDDAMEIIRQRHGEWHPVENKAAEKDDMVVFNQETLIDDKRIGHSENSNYIIGQGLRFMGKSSKELGEALVGAKTGDTKEITLKIPDDTEKAEYRGKDAVLKIAVKEVKKMEIPKLTEEWAKSIGFESISNMREQVNKRIMKQKEDESNFGIEEQIFEELVKKTEFPLPDSLVEDNVNYILRKWMTDMLIQKKPEKEIMAEIETLKPKAKELSEKQLRMQFICDHIAKKEKIFVTEDDVNQRINELAGRYQRWPNEIKKYYEDNHLMGQLRSELREEKVRKFLREKAVITESKTVESAKPADKAKHHKEEKKG